MRSKDAVKGDIVRYTGPVCFDLTIGRLYEIFEVGTCNGSSFASFKDDKGTVRAFWDSASYEVVGKATPDLFLSDIHGQAVRNGDYIAYAFAGSRFPHMAVFEVMAINPGDGKYALCRSVTDDATINLGVFQDRALKLKDYNK